MVREQFIAQVKATQRAFRRFLVALCCGDAALADDVAQESYIKAYMACGEVENPDRFGAWIYRIGYTTFINHKRSQRITVDLDSACDLTARDSADGSFKYQELYAALNMLPVKERTSVILYYMENYSVKEIAELQSASQDAVKQHLSRGRNHLRALLTSNQQ
ncbi:MAG: RNA polymerase sigma factor [Muribaculaceae bacterium]|nr:RNA polymerase sigma factor [Muribaculaceae bacterium]